MHPEIKFCGLTREGDIDAAVALGARYLGVVFAGGPRTVGVDRARQLLSRVPEGIRRVGVFGRPEADASLGHVARQAGLDVIQLHADPDAEAIANARKSFTGPVWAALRVRGNILPAHASELFEMADAVVLDAYSAASLGGTGVALPWQELADVITGIRKPGRLVLAGGLRADTVSAAVRALRPDVVDVSSGVESAPGVKDHAKLRAFRDAVWGEPAAP